MLAAFVGESAANDVCVGDRSWLELTVGSKEDVPQSHRALEFDAESVVGVPGVVRVVVVYAEEILDGTTMETEQGCTSSFLKRTSISWDT